MIESLDHIYHIAPQHEDDHLYDLYCGGGGSGSGILNAFKRLGRTPVGTFVNHWDRAIEIHNANHPEHRHMKEDLFLLKPDEVMPKQRYSMGWASPSCQQFSISRGNRPINEQGRSHCDTVVEWIAHCRPEVQWVENVKEFLDHGPLRQRRDKKSGELQWAKEVPGKKKGTTSIKPQHDLPQTTARQPDEPEAEWELRMISMDYLRHLEPDPKHKGEYFKAWIKAIEDLGYVSDWKLLTGADYGSPTIRKRLFVQFVRRDTGKRIVWPDQRFIKPGAKRPAFKTNPDRELLPWPTARGIIHWNVKGTSIFQRPKPLAKATMRRIAIGLVKFGLRDFIVPASNFGGDRVRSTDLPASTIQRNTRGEGLAIPQTFALTSNKGFGNGVRDLDKPAATLTTHARGEGLVETQPFILPKDQGHLADYVTGVDQPCCTVQTTAVDHLCEPAIVQLNKCSTAISVDQPLGAVTTEQKQYVMEPCITKLRGTGTACSVDEPVRTLTAGGQHQGLSEPEIQVLGSAFLQVMDNAGKHGVNQRAFSVDEPVKTIPSKANQTLVEPALESVDAGHPLLFPYDALAAAVTQVALPRGVDASRVLMLLEPLMEELRKVGRADVKPWVYAYYSSGSVGADINTPVPTIRCKAGSAVCYPVLEFDGVFIKLDVLYRMLLVAELQAAQGFPADFVWPAHLTKTEIIRAIGNSVCCDVAEALTLAYYNQDEDISAFFETPQPL